REPPARRTLSVDPDGDGEVRANHDPGAECCINLVTVFFVQRRMYGDLFRIECEELFDRPDAYLVVAIRKLLPRNIVSANGHGGGVGFAKCRGGLERRNSDRFDTCRVGKPHYRRNADPQAGKASRPGGYGDQPDVAETDGRFFQQIVDLWQKV